MKRLLVLCGCVLILRLLLLPYISINNEGDSVTRTFIAWQWMENPKLITYGGWGPLHFYLIAAALKVWLNPLFSPSVLHILFSVATAIPLWAFVRREWGEPGAIFVTAVFLFNPLSFRLSFLAVSEIPLLFFVALAMYFLSRARSELVLSNPIFAGLCMTLACALRVEAWFLSFLFAFVLWGQWKKLLLYGSFAALFPVFWIIGNALSGSDPIGYLAATKHWQIDVEGINEGLNAARIFQRLIYFPVLVFFGLSPIITILCIAGVIFSWQDRAKRLWFIPFAVMLPIYMLQTVRGIGSFQARFSLLLFLLLIPFSAAAVQRMKSKPWFRTAAILIIAVMFFSGFSRAALARIAGPSFPNPFPADLEPIPKIRQQTKEIARIVRDHINETDGVVLDFFVKDFYPYKETFHVALAIRVHPSRLFVMPTGRYQTLDVNTLTDFLKHHPTGLLLRSDYSRFLHLAPNSNAPVLLIDGYPGSLALERINSVKSITIYRYTVNSRSLN